MLDTELCILDSFHDFSMIIFYLILNFLFLSVFTFINMFFIINDNNDSSGKNIIHGEQNYFDAPKSNYSKQTEQTHEKSSKNIIKILFEYKFKIIFITCIFFICYFAFIFMKS